MSTGSTVFQLRRLAALSLVGFWLAGCSSGDNTQAPISQIGSNSGDSGMAAAPTTGGGMIAAQNQHRAGDAAWWNVKRWYTISRACRWNG